ncbi:hypothetical protein AXK57_21975 [Tsukamurella pulmonis]|uniref:hypothetical protein n=1 Tax=Tsukamurella pulmonis TaxID=47312 RepID=UPI00079B7D7A|nr:hypothetical protein [Tsukamurella pulmonis]KXP11612.1 hypothetical protein AXK57_21975 [Tsukamurella pulmonis]
MPPPRHSAPPPPARPKDADDAPASFEGEGTAPAVEDAGEGEGTAAAAVVKEDAAAAPPAPAPAPAAPLSAAPKGRAVSPSTIYFDEATDDYLEEVAIAGRRGRPKIDSRSAFARLAVRRMMEQLTPEQAVEILRAQGRAEGDGKAGRPLH